MLLFQAKVSRTEYFDILSGGPCNVITGQNCANAKVRIKQMTDLNFDKFCSEEIIAQNCLKMWLRGAVCGVA